MAKGGVMEEFFDSVMQWLIQSGARIIAIVIFSFVLLRVIRVMIRKSRDRIGSPDVVGLERAKRAETLAGIIEATARVIVAVGAGLMGLKALGLDIGPLLAGAGVVGLAVGFGAQSLVKDVIGGFFILLENHMNVGDVVEIQGVAGLVESINLRVTTLRDLNGRMHVVPNGEIQVITNMTKEWSRAVLEIGVAYKEDVDEVIRVIKEVGEEMRSDDVFGGKILEPLEVLGVESFGDSSVNIKIRIKTKPIEQWNVEREYRRRIKKAFDEQGIEIPFPHRTIYIGEAESKGRIKVDIGSAGPRPE